MSPDWYQTHQLCNTSDDFCATLNCYRYGEEDRVQWNQFDYVNKYNGQMENFMPNTDFHFGKLWRIILDEWFKNSESDVSSLIERFTQIEHHVSLLTNNPSEEWFPSLDTDKNSDLDASNLPEELDDLSDKEEDGSIIILEDKSAHNIIVDFKRFDIADPPLPIMEFSIIFLFF